MTGRMGLEYTLNVKRLGGERFRERKGQVIKTERGISFLPEAIRFIHFCPKVSSSFLRLALPEREGTIA
jgi:hypothetical protein